MMIGEFRDEEILPDGSRRLVAEGRNLVVNSAAVAIALAMRPVTSPSNQGFLWMAVGDGNTTDSTAWDAGITGNTIVAAESDSGMLRETYRKAVTPTDVTFVDGAGNESASPTNRLKIVMTLVVNEPSSSGNVDLREWGFFGGDATSTAGTGKLINRKVHKTYLKTPAAQLQRTLIFSF